jgi:hypothetical protein
VQDPNNFEATDPGGISAAGPPARDRFTPSDTLTGHLAALIPGHPQAVLEAAAGGLIALGYGIQEPESDYVPVLTEEAIVRAANQMRSQTRDFTSSDILMRKRARFVLIAAIRYLRVEPVR